jgi:hypothetical protein
MRTEDVNTSNESVPLAELAAEATNEGSPAQSVPETIPPQARTEKDKEKQAQEKRPASNSRG